MARAILFCFAASLHLSGKTRHLAKQGTLAEAVRVEQGETGKKKPAAQVPRAMAWAWMEAENQKR
ncbi:MAG: hypothetical protein Tsb0017_11940 [Geothermobacteraceae bacterium]